MKRKNAIEPRIDTDETRIMNGVFRNSSCNIRVNGKSRVTRVFIRVDPCSSVASKRISG